MYLLQPPNIVAQLISTRPFCGRFGKPDTKYVAALHCGSAIFRKSEIPARAVQRLGRVRSETGWVALESLALGPGVLPGAGRFQKRLDFIQCGGGKRLTTPRFGQHIPPRAQVVKRHAVIA